VTRRLRADQKPQIAPIRRDVALPDDPDAPSADGGRMYVMAIGIDRYRSWGRLHNAVGDARGALAAFANLGFEQFRPALIDDAATGEAIRGLVTDELRTLGENDSLVLFFAGHGHTVTKTFPDGTCTKNGYLVPVDADLPGGRIGSWLSLKSWLSEVAQLPPRHILVVLDACHSGVALDPVIRWRGADVRRSDPVDRLRARRSRRIITSALDDQLALDSGPVHGHSLFTGCLIEALTGGMISRPGQSIVTGSELGLYVQRRVIDYPASQNQTPDFGALELDDRGELTFALSAPVRDHDTPPGPGESKPRSPTGPHEIWPKAARLATVPQGATESMGPGSIKSNKRASTAPPIPATTITPPAKPAAPPVARDVTGPPAKPAVSPGSRSTPAPAPPIAASPSPVKDTRGKTSATTTTTTSKPMTASPAPAPISRAASGPSAPARPSGNAAPAPDVPAPSPRPGAPALEAAFVTALDRHVMLRNRGGNVLSMVTSDPTTALLGWGTWAAGHGWLTLLTEGNGLDAAVADLLAQTPWLRMLPAARERLARIARIDPQDVDAALDARSCTDRDAWIDDVSGRDPHARVSGWLLSALREPWAHVPDLTTAPVQGAELLSIVGDLAAPLTVLLHHPEPTAPWLEQAIRTAAELIAYVPRLAVAVAAPDELVRRVLRDHADSTVMSLARQGVVPLAPRPARPASQPRARPEELLHQALARNPSTASLFTPNVAVPIHDRERAVEVDLVARDALFAVEIDDWYHVRDPQSYRRDRIKDVWLQRAGFFVTRFLAEDVEDRLERVVEEIALGIGARRASGSLAEKFP
jgi:caspase domain-containing protein/uncharacterized protein DUF559